MPRTQALPHLRAGMAAGASVLLLLVASSTACARAHAKTVPDLPPLDMPAPPPRVVEPIETEVSPPVPLVEEPQRRAPARPPARPRPEPGRPEPPRNEPSKVEPAPEPPRAIEEPPKPPSTLQTTPAGAEGDVERAIRAQIARATADLNRVNYRGLNADARTQYDTAKRFVAQAENALRAKNLVFARNLADKAAALAAQLAGR